jgi:dihydrofolate synthase/folylpolyglutamate synthase
VIHDVARDREAPLVLSHDGVHVEAMPAPTDGGQAIRLRTPRRDYGVLDLHLEGRHQIDNAVVAVRVLECVDQAGLSCPQTAVADGLASVKWPGRLEHIRLAGGRSLLLDAAHNPAGAEALAAFLAARGGRQQPLVFAAMRDKDVRGILAALVPCVSDLVLTRASNPRSADPRSLLDIASALTSELPMHVEDSVRDALARAWQLSPHIVVAGSIFLLGDVLQELQRT